MVQETGYLLQIMIIFYYSKNKSLARDFMRHGQRAAMHGKEDVEFPWSCSVKQEGEITKHSLVVDNENRGGVFFVFLLSI